MNNLKQINTTDYDLQQLQDNVRVFAQQLLSIDLLNGQLLTGIILSTGDNTIAHKLGRAMVGYFMVNSNTAITLYSKTSASPLQSMILNSSAGATVSLWVF